MTTYHEQMREAQRKILTIALTEARGNRAQAARALGLQRTYLIRMIRETGIESYVSVYVTVKGTEVIRRAGPWRRRQRRVAGGKA